MEKTIIFGDTNVDYTNPCDITISKNTDGYVLVYKNEKIGVVGEKEGVLEDLSRHLEYMVREED